MANFTAARTNRNRKIKWYGEYSQSGKSMKCYTKGGHIVLIDRKTGHSNPGVNIRHKRKRVEKEAITTEFGDREWVPQEELEKIQQEQ